MLRNKAMDVSANTGGYSPSQPSQRFPFRPVTPPRVDNKNQPWYGGNRLGATADDWQDQDVITQDSDVGQPTQDLTDVWNKFNGFYGGNDAKANLIDQSNVNGWPSQVPSAIAQNTPDAAAASGVASVAPVASTVPAQNFWLSLAAFFNTIGLTKAPNAQPAPVVSGGQS